MKKYGWLTILTAVMLVLGCIGVAHAEIIPPYDPGQQIGYPAPSSAASHMYPSNRAAQADEDPIAIFFHDGKPGIFAKQSDLGRRGIIPGVNRRLLFSDIPGRVDDDVV